MKNYIALILIGLVCYCADAQINLLTHTWNITLKVIDEHGNPLSKARAGVGFYTNSQPASIEGTTDSNGLFYASQNVGLSAAGYSLVGYAEKDGYYGSHLGLNLDAKYDFAKWHPTVLLTLKKVGKPIAMFAKRIDSEPTVFKKTGRTLIAFTNTVAYDFTTGDWVAPHGKGVNADVFFTEEFIKKSTADYYYKLSVSFPNKGDGIQGYVREWNQGVSGLISSHEAPLDGYQPKYEQTQISNPDKIYYFRVRTVLDQNGNVVSARYGKIYGDFMQFTYYLNPTPNDRNIEFDLKQNLFHGRDDSFKVSQP